MNYKMYCVFKKSVSQLQSHTQFISILNGVILVLRVRHAQSITRSLMSCLPRTLAGGFVHSVHMKRQYNIGVESTGSSSVTLAKLFNLSEPPCPHLR